MQMRRSGIGVAGEADRADHLALLHALTTPEAKWYEPSLPINPYPLLMRR